MPYVQALTVYSIITSITNRFAVVDDGTRLLTLPRKRFLGWEFRTLSTKMNFSARTHLQLGIQCNELSATAGVGRLRRGV